MPDDLIKELEDLLQLASKLIKRISLVLQQMIIVKYYL